MKIYDNNSIWFVTGSQHLYGEKTLEEVGANGQHISEALNEQKGISSHIEFKGVLTTANEILNFSIDAQSDSTCVGVIFWMHTFSPAKMWINGLKQLSKPKLHLHTQFVRDIPWDSIDMNYMNTNQSAHGDREFGYINTRLGIKRKVVVGHWKERDVIEEIGTWTRATAGYKEISNLKIARFEDNMRGVAVTEGDKVEAQIKLGCSVDAYGIGDLVSEIEKLGDAEVDALIQEYEQKYNIVPALKKAGAHAQSLRYSAKIEIALEKFLERGGYKAYTTNFETLHGMEQLPGMSVQRLMEKGYGFGGEGDWKAAALVRVMKIMGQGIDAGTSFMEDYVYHFHPGEQKVLGAHMLEVCPSIAATIPSVEIHPLSIGGKANPVRMVFNAKPGDAINVSWIDMGDRFRFIVNEVRAEKLTHDMPKLPVARTLWTPLPCLKTAAKLWILAGGSHHTSFSQAVNASMFVDFAEMLDIETLLIDKDTNTKDFMNELKWNEVRKLLH